VKFLTIRQPWASLIAVGAKTIETRPFSTRYRGPLAIHAGLAMPDVGSFVGRYVVQANGYKTRAAWDVDSNDRHPLPLGAVVAVCDLVDVVPIVTDWPDEGAVVMTYPDGQQLLYRLGYGAGDDIDDQLPLGDFTPGRYAWLLSNVRPIEPVPMKGAQGLRDVPEAVADGIVVAAGRATEGQP
jgi:hypothetical protein